LASVDRENTSVTDLLAAQVAAYEVGIRAGFLLWPNSAVSRRHTAGTAAALGVAAGVSRLTDSDSETTARALRIAWGHAPMSALQLPMGKEALGWAAATGVFAATLASAGFLGSPVQASPSTVGSVRDVWPDSPFDEPRAEHEFVTSLGVVYEAAHTYFKPYPACRYTHAALDAVSQLMHAQGLTAGDIASITVRTHRRGAWLNAQHPATLEHAQYSFPFVIAALLVKGSAGADVICDANLSDRLILELAGRVSVIHEESLDVHYPGRYPAAVSVLLRSGNVLNCERLAARGDIDMPLAPDQLEAKFRQLAVPIIGPDRAEGLVELSREPTDRAVSDLLLLLLG